MAKVRSGLFGWIAASLLIWSCTGEPRQERAASGTVAGRSVEGAAQAGLNDRLLLAAAKVALPPPGVQPGDLPDPYSQGAQAVARYCSSCHNLPSPTLHSATDWPGVVRRMWLRMDRLPADLQVPVPTVAERHYILDYLVANALQVSGATLPAGPGREIFAQTCSRCHALPDPYQHSPEDWPTVIRRMEQRMTQMNVEVPQPGEIGAILTYLQNVSARRRQG
ncbi:MAG: hypothetical protein KatS3mg081_1562 [Gemmatimonadales bacterium]|nr:MAG: hypothetical protein KatS3mg081_1562 [Gemmatimonadales bacterium]